LADKARVRSTRLRDGKLLVQVKDLGQSGKELHGQVRQSGKAR
jgi:hypothetical protein